MVWSDIDISMIVVILVPVVIGLSISGPLFELFQLVKDRYN